MAWNPNTQQEDPNYKPGIIGLPAINQPAQAVPTPVATKSWEVTPQQTVQEQVRGIIAENSPLMQQAQTTAKQEANARGLLNSSMAVGAGQDAVIRAAIPIAMADANTYAASAQANTAAENAAGMQTAQLGTQTSQFNTGELNRQNMQLLDIEGQKQLAEINNKYSMQIRQSDSAAGLYDTYQRTINAILLNPDLSNEPDPTTGISPKQFAINTQAQMLESGMQLYSSLDALNIAALLGAPTTGTPTTPAPGGTGLIGAVSNANTGLISQQATQQAAADLLSRQQEWDRQMAYLQNIEGGRLTMENAQRRIQALGPRPTV